MQAFYYLDVYVVISQLTTQKYMIYIGNWRVEKACCIMKVCKEGFLILYEGGKFSLR